MAGLGGRRLDGRAARARGRLSACRRIRVGHVHRAEGAGEGPDVRVWLALQVAIFVVAALALAVVWSPWVGIAVLLVFVANLLLLLKLDSVP